MDPLIVGEALVFGLRVSQVTDSRHSVRIQENYRNYRPPVSADRLVEKYLDYVPPVHLLGLKEVVLTNVEAMNRKRKREKTWSRKRKVSLKQCRGLYHQEWQGKPAWIELFVDNIFDGMPRFLSKIPFFRDMNFSSTLYHEVGHHIHNTQVKEYRERENVADAWKIQLSRNFLWKKYWYWKIALFPLFWLRRITLKYARK